MYKEAAYACTAMQNSAGIIKITVHIPPSLLSMTKAELGNLIQ